MNKVYYKDTLFFYEWTVLETRFGKPSKVMLEIAHEVPSFLTKKLKLRRLFTKTWDVTDHKTFAHDKDARLEEELEELFKAQFPNRVENVRFIKCSEDFEKIMSI